jgi:hypothetical protein
MYDMGRAFYLAADMVARLDPEMIGIVLLSFRQPCRERCRVFARSAAGRIPRHDTLLRPHGASRPHQRGSRATASCGRPRDVSGPFQLRATWITGSSVHADRHDRGAKRASSPDRGRPDAPGRRGTLGLYCSVEVVEATVIERSCAAVRAIGGNKTAKMMPRRARRSIVSCFPADLRTQYVWRAPFCWHFCSARESALLAERLRGVVWT